MTIRSAYLVILGVACMVIGGAWIFEVAGYKPCHLCLLQRWPWYGAIALSALCAAFMPNQRFGLYILALVFAGSFIFGVYHSGVEWKFWAGPASCTGTIAGSTGLPNLSNAPVVTCGEAALRILGLSLAGWNAVLSLALMGFALYGARWSIKR